jgi:hypothetical protein
LREAVFKEGKAVQSSDVQKARLFGEVVGVDVSSPKSVIWQLRVRNVAYRLVRLPQKVVWEIWRRSGFI